jgi:peptidoglycan hydrolase-like protein with peptidoglycan-binding domain
MHRVTLAVLFAAITLSLTLPAVPPTSSTPKKKTTKSKSKAKARPAAPPRQSTPGPERYREIQQSLVEKGYLKSPPSGVWDAESTEAMRRFQAANQLDVTGKLSSKTLIALGLGPKESSPPPAAPPKPQ